jgi:polysaccharide biosynthesis protein PelB
VRGAFAAGYMALGEPRRALPHYLALLKREPDNYLWLLNYADALEQSGSPELAQRVRHHAWLNVRPKLAKLAANSPASRAELLKHARSLLREAPGDASYAAIAKLISEDGLGDSERAIVNELALAWAFSNESYDTARAWLWNRYAQAMRAPYYAQVALALEAGERDKLQDLLTHHERDLGSYDKIEAAKTLGNAEQARGYVFGALSRSPSDDNLHTQLVDTAMPLAKNLAPAIELTKQGAVSTQDYSLGFSMPTPLNTRASVIGLTRRQSSHDANVIKDLPAGEEQLELQLEANHDRGQSTVRIGRRNAIGDMTLLAVSRRFDLAQGFSLTPRLGRNQAAEESLGLKLGGAKDVVGWSWVYNFSKREYLYGDATYNRYHSQQRRYLGQGQQIYLEAGHRFRTEYPDFTVRVGSLLQRYRHDGELDSSLSALLPANAAPSVDFFVPRSSNQLSLGAGVGESARDNYARAPRPFASAYVSHNSVAGAGYNAMLGLSGSVLGGDRLQLYLSFGQDLNGAKDQVKTLGLSYRYNF